MHEILVVPMSQAAFLSMPLAWTVGKTWNDFTTLPMDYTTMFYWWTPDTTFLRPDFGEASHSSHEIFLLTSERQSLRTRLQLHLVITCGFSESPFIPNGASSPACPSLARELALNTLHARPEAGCQVAHLPTPRLARVRTWDVAIDRDVHLD